MSQSSEMGLDEVHVVMGSIAPRYAHAMSLEQIRSQIDAIDAQMITLLAPSVSRSCSRPRSSSPTRLRCAPRTDALR